MGKSPLAEKRGPRKLGRDELLRKIAKLQERRARKTKHVIASSRMWPGQVEAGVKALDKFLHRDSDTSGYWRVYPGELEKIVRAVFKAAVNARVEQAKVLKRRAAKREGKWEGPWKGPQKAFFETRAKSENAPAQD